MLRISSIERVRGGNQRSDTTRAQLVERLKNEIVVDAQPVLVVRRIVDDDLAERDIAYREVVRIVRSLEITEVLVSNVGVLVKLLKDAAGGRVELYCGSYGNRVRRKVGRLKAEEVSNPSRRFKYTIPSLKSETTQYRP